MTLDKFLDNCTCCGGNWTAMFISGIKSTAPKVYEELPDITFTFHEIAFIVNHLCEDRPHFRFICDKETGRVWKHTIDGKFTYRAATGEELKMSNEKFDWIYNHYKSVNTEIGES